MMNKKYTILAVLLFMCSVLWAKVGGKMYVNVGEAVLKAGTGFFASDVGTLSYGSQVKILKEKGKWVQVVSADDDALEGWLPISSLTKKKILLDNGLFSVDASADELALAGKGFSAEMEALYMNEALEDAFGLVDNIEANAVDKDSLLLFIQDGELCGEEP